MIEFSFRIVQGIAECNSFFRKFPNKRVIFTFVVNVQFYTRFNQTLKNV